MARYLINAKNSKFIVTAQVSSILSDSPSLINRYFFGNAVFESFRIKTNVITTETSVEIVNTRTGKTVSSRSLGSLIPASSSVPVSGIFDLMYSICGDTLTISGRDTATASSQAQTYKLNTSSFGAPVRFTNPLVAKVNQLSFGEEGLFGFQVQPMYGFDPLCSVVAVLDQPGTFTQEDDRILIASIALAVSALIVAISLLVAFLVRLYPPSSAIDPSVLQ